MGLLAIPILFSISVWNGYPLVYEDTQGYMSQPATVGHALGLPNEWADEAKARWLVEERRQSKAASPKDSPAPQFGRSIYYGTLIYLLSLVGGLWAVVLAKAAMVGLVVALLWFRCFDFRSGLGFTALLFGLAAATSAGLFANLVMPDIFSGLLILSLAMLFVFWGKLQQIDKVALTAVATLAVISHSSHLLLAIGALVVATLLRFVMPDGRRAHISKAGLGVGIGVVVSGIVAIVVYGMVIGTVFGKAPQRLPHMTAHLVSHPILADFLRDNCDVEAPQWAVCAYRERLPIVWTNFLFSRDAAKGGFATADPEQRQALSDQDAQLMLAVFRSDPLATGAMMLGATGKQLVMTSYSDLSPQTKSAYIDDNFPPRVRDEIHGSRLWSDDSAMWIGSNIQQVVTVISIPVIILCFIGFLKYGIAIRERLLIFPVFVIICVAINAFICGTLAFPYDRFQARIIWLIPLLAIIMIPWLYFLYQNKKTLAVRNH
jgi:hypothetical protein